MAWLGGGRWRITVFKHEPEIESDDDDDDDNADYDRDLRSFGYEVFTEEELPAAHRVYITMLQVVMDDLGCGELEGVGTIYNWRTDNQLGPTVYLDAAIWGDVDCSEQQ